jgi:SAM-dependent methyltransferase
MSKHRPWIRYVMDDETEKLVRACNPDQLDVCEISGTAWHDAFPWRSYESREYPAFDVCTHPFERQFDLIIAEQVFEHVRYPWRAAANMYSGLRRGGHVLITTPFMFHIHPTPLDCWRWTPQGMGFMLEDVGFKPKHIVTGGWGNYECFLRHAIDQSSAPEMRPELSLANVGHIPQVVWGFATKT